MDYSFVILYQKYIALLNLIILLELQLYLQTTARVN